MKDRGGFPNTGCAAQIIGVAEWGVSRRSELDELEFSAQFFDDSLKMFLRPLFIENRLTPAHAAALDDDLPMGPGGCCFLRFVQEEIGLNGNLPANAGLSA